MGKYDETPFAEAYVCFFFFLSCSGELRPKRHQIVPTCFPAVQLSRGVKPARKNEVLPHCATPLLCA